MAIKSIGKITLYNSLTKDELTTLLSGTDIIVFEIEKAYELGEKPNRYGAVINTDFAGSNTNYIESLKNIIDVSSFIIEQNVLIYKINFNANTKEFSLLNSFVRTEKDTNETQGTIPQGQILNATFYTPGINGLVATTIELPFGEEISSTHKDNLIFVGLELNLNVTGSLFSIKTQSVPFKVVFSKPSAETTDYLIDFELQNIIIEI